VNRVPAAGHELQCADRHLLFVRRFAEGAPLQMLETLPGPAPKAP